MKVEREQDEKVKKGDKGERIESKRGPVVPQGQRPGGCAGACLIQIAGALKL